MPKTERPSRFRLSPDVRPHEYDIHLEPDLDAGRFRGEVRIAVALDGARREVVLHAAELKIEREEDAPGGRVVHFAPTPPLSTYLFALAVGALEASAERLLGTVPIRIWHVPGKGHLTELGLEAAAEALRRLEDYFDIPYPYGKLDLVAVPDFEAGAMENAGAVFFRETLLLLDPATASLNERKRAAEVIAHELAD